MVLNYKNWLAPMTSVLVFLFVILLQENKVSASVRFYKDYGFKGGLLYESHAKMGDGCVNLPYSADNKASSLNTGCLCVDLFDGKDCDGETSRNFLRTPYDDQYDLLHFDKKTSSFRICSELPKPSPNAQVALYRHTCYMDPLLDYKEVCGCTNLPQNARNQISSVNPNVNCIRLYAEENCHGQMKEFRADGDGRGHYDFAEIFFNDITQSIGPCDDERHQYCSRIKKPLLLNGKVFRVEYHAPQVTGSNNANNFKTENIKTGRRQVFKNDEIRIKMQKYVNQFTQNDSFQKSLPVAVRQLKTLTEVNNVSYQRIHSRADGNVAELEPLPSSDGWRTLNEINEENKNVIKTKAIYFSRNSKGNEYEKYFSKWGAMRIVNENLDKEIIENLKTNFQTVGKGPQAFGVAADEQMRSKEFVINKTVALPPCTEYEMKSYIKRTTGLPVFSTYLEITGTYEEEDSNNGKGTAASAREIIEKLEEMEGFKYVETKDNETVVVDISGGKMLMDFSWYAVWEGAWKAIDGCKCSM